MLAIPRTPGKWLQRKALWPADGNRWFWASKHGLYANQMWHGLRKPQCFPSQMKAICHSNIGLSHSGFLQNVSGGRCRAVNINLLRGLVLALFLLLMDPTSSFTFVATLILMAQEFLTCSKLHPTSLSFGVGFWIWARAHWNSPKGHRARGL